MTAGGDGKARAASGCYAGAAAVLLLTAVFGAVLYPGMPDRVPVHWDGKGAADSFAPKSALAVFEPVLMGLGSVVFLWLLDKALPLVGKAQKASSAPDIAAGRAVVSRLAPAMAVFICWLSIRGWLGWEGPALIWVPTVGFMFFGIWLVFRAVSALGVPADGAPTSK